MTCPLISLKIAPRGFKSISFIVSSPTYTEGMKKAKVNRSTFYKWLKVSAFKEELDRKRDEIADEAFGVLSQSLTKAVETLVALLDNKDDRLKRLTAKDIIDFMIRHKEIEDLDKRLTAIEQRLDSRKR